jgi:hypothetical protein
MAMGRRSLAGLDAEVTDCGYRILPAWSLIVPAS